MSTSTEEMLSGLVLYTDLQDLALTNQQYFQSNFVWDLINDQQEQFEMQLMKYL